MGNSCRASCGKRLGHGDDRECPVHWLHNVVLDKTSNVDAVPYELVHVLTRKSYASAELNLIISGKSSGRNTFDRID